MSGIDNLDDLQTAERQVISIDNDTWHLLSTMLERWDNEGLPRFQHPAEYVAFYNLLGALQRRVPCDDFGLGGEERMDLARKRRADGFEGNVPGLGYVRVASDGSIVPGMPHDREACNSDAASADGGAKYSLSVKLDRGSFADAKGLNRDTKN